MDLTKSNGIAVICGLPVSTFKEEYRDHPQLVFWNQDEVGNIPANIKALVIGPKISHADSRRLIKEAKSRKAVIFRQVHSNESKKIIDSLIGKTEKKDKKTLPKNWLSDFLEKNANLHAENIAAESERLFPLLAEQGLETTINSIAQAIYALRKRKNIGTIPKSIKPKELVLKETLEGMIKDLVAMKDAIVSYEEENVKLKNQIARFRKALEGTE